MRGDQPEPAPPKLVTIAEFNNQAEFLLARTRLESAAIECFAQERDLLHFGWHSHGGGIRLQVRESDVEEALALVHAKRVRPVAPTIIQSPAELLAGEPQSEVPIKPAFGLMGWKTEASCATSSWELSLPFWFL